MPDIVVAVDELVQVVGGLGVVGVDVLKLVVAGGQHRLPISLGGALDLELGHEGGLPRLGLVLRFLKQLLLLGQLRCQQIMLFGEPVAFLFLGTPSSVSLAQLLLEGGVGA